LDADTTIIGAGPYGLTIAAHLRAARQSCHVLGTPLESWRSFMPTGMILKSERFASNLWDPARRYTLRRYSEASGLSYQAVGSPVALTQFLTYAQWFRDHAVGELHDVKVMKLRQLAHGFSLELADGRTLKSHRVVLATGHMAFRVLPPQLDGLPEPQVMHSARLGGVNGYSGREVTIIGAGQSALETAALLHEAGAHVRIVVRRGRLEWNPPSRPRPFWQRILEPDAGIASGWGSVAVSELPRTFRWRFAAAKRHRFVAAAYGPSGSWWLRDRVDGKVEICLSSQVEEAKVEAGKVRLAIRSPDGVGHLVTDHVVAATGYKVDVDRLEYLDPGLRSGILREVGGIPALSSRYETSVPGLFIVGIASAPVFGPIMRFMYGAKHVGPVLSSRLRSAA
jgi:cation diffusion facilitator CzcD-associated flavoprotein CzcO